MKEYKKKIEGVTVKYRLMDRKLRLEAKEKGITLASLQRGDNIEDIIDFAFDNCVLNADECGGLTIVGEVLVMKAIMLGTEDVEEEASKN